MIDSQQFAGPPWPGSKIAFILSGENKDFEGLQTINSTAHGSIYTKEPRSQHESQKRIFFLGYLNALTGCCATGMTVCKYGKEEPSDSGHD